MELDITIIEKLKGLLGEIRKLKLSVSLFAVVQREDTDTWDLIFGGDDIETKDNLDLIVKNIKKIFEENERIIIPRLVLLDLKNPLINEISNAFSIEEGGTLKIQNSRIGNVFIKNGYLLYSKKNDKVNKTAQVESGKGVPFNANSGTSGTEK